MCGFIWAEIGRFALGSTGSAFTPVLALFHNNQHKCLEKYCGYGFLSDKEGRPILMSLLGNMDVEGNRYLSCSRGARFLAIARRASERSLFAHTLRSVSYILCSAALGGQARTMRKPDLYGFW
ncbi:hypothetical protein ANCDUO_26972 [Ancylostoma duodenale]|uniref:Uncharacterized protein n=1 Tax=Ancylostoma duodenale TaxID=51022 RepID=A0A0C2F7Y2_9BILA|nr:hypothetical protein ANCDUO_26972 [Ancylostoma duodenale]